MKKSALVAVLVAAALVSACSDDAETAEPEPTVGSSSTAPADPEPASDDDFAALSAAEISQASLDAMSGLETFRLDGTATMEGTDYALALALRPGGCSGTITVDGGTMELLGVDGQLWYRADDAFWEDQLPPAQAKQIIKRVAGRWIVSDTQSDPGVSQYCSSDSAIETLGSGDPGAGTLEEEVELTDVDGTPAVAITQVPDGQKPLQGLIQVEGEHYLIGIRREDSEDPIDVTLSAFDEPFDADAPAEADTVRLEELFS